MEFVEIYFALNYFFITVRFLIMAEMKRDSYEKAQKAFKAATDAKSTSIIKWKPNFDVAITEYEKAANLYRLAGMPNDSIKSYQLAAECCEFRALPMRATELYYKAASLARDEKKMEAAADFFSKAAMGMFNIITVDSFDYVL